MSYRDGNYEIYIMNSDGTGQTNLSNHPGNDQDPCPSPDGERILFKSFRDDSLGSLYTIRPDGSDLTLFGGSWVSGYSCEGWSPDSSSFVFNENTGNGDGKLLVRTMSGEEYSPGAFSSVQNGYGQAVWSNTGDMIAYYRQGRDYGGVYQSDIYGNTPNIFFERPSTEGWVLSWSPDDTELLVQSGYEIFIQPNSNFASKTKITNHPGMEYIGPGAWNSSGTKITFGRDQKLHLMNPDGSGVVALGEGHPRSDAADWSSDDSQLVYTCVLEETRYEEICIIDADGSNQKQLTDIQFNYGPRFVP
jgi:Tol biopolymer transport system component